MSEIADSLARIRERIESASGRAGRTDDIVLVAVSKNIAIESVPRRIPIIHRRFDATALRTAFPEFRPTSFDTGIRETIAALRRT